MKEIPLKKSSEQFKILSESKMFQADFISFFHSSETFQNKKLSGLFPKNVQKMFQINSSKNDVKQLL